jgi:hypothetical protein
MCAISIDTGCCRPFEAQIAGRDCQDSFATRTRIGFSSRRTFDIEAVRIEYPVQLLDRERPSRQELQSGTRCDAVHEPWTAVGCFQVEVDPFRRNNGRSTDRTRKGHGLPLRVWLDKWSDRLAEFFRWLLQQEIRGTLQKEIGTSPFFPTRKTRVARGTGDASPSGRGSAATKPHCRASLTGPGDEGRATPCSLGSMFRGSGETSNGGTARV